METIAQNGIHLPLPIFQVHACFFKTNQFQKSTMEMIIAKIVVVLKLVLDWTFQQEQKLLMIVIIYNVMEKT